MMAHRWQTLGQLGRRCSITFTITSCWPVCPNVHRHNPMRLCGAPHVKGSRTSSRRGQVASFTSDSSPYTRTSQSTAVLERATQLAAAAALAVLWLLGRSAQASAGILPRSSMPQLESMVSIAPQATVTASVTNPNDSMLLIVAVCLGFWMLSATISAAIGALMHMSGRSLQYGTRGAANWGTAGIVDTFDIMRLPLAYEIDEPSSSKAGSNRTGDSTAVLYIPWDGPESARRSMLQPEQNLSIISITSSAQQTTDAAGLLENSNGNGHINGKNGRSSNGSKKS